MQLNSFRTLHLALVTLGLAALLSSCGGGGTTTDSMTAGPVPASANGLRAFPIAFASRAVAYSPYRTATTNEGRDAETIIDSQVKTDLDLLVTAGIGLIRVFDSSDKVALRTLRVIRANSMPIKVMLGVYVNTYEYATDQVVRARVQAGNEDELARGVRLAQTYASEVVAVSVGNETQVSWSFVPISSTVLAGYIKNVRDQITQPVTTDDNWAVYAGIGRNASDQIADVLRQIDFASIHSYPIEDVLYSNSDPITYWDWQQLAVTDLSQRAAAMMDAAIGKTQKDYAAARTYMDSIGRANLPIVIGETGWKAADPSGTARYKFLGNPVNQKLYYQRLLDWAVASASGSGPKGIVYFQAFDEPWKGTDDNWGLFNVARQARCAAQILSPSATWNTQTGSCADAGAVYFVPPTLNAAVTTPTLVIHSEAVTGWPTGLRADPYASGTFTLVYPQTGDSAAGDTASAGLGASHYLSLTGFNNTAGYGWGLLWQSSAATPVTANMSNFANGAIRFSVKTGYVGKLRVGISSDTTLGSAAEASVILSSGDYGYCTNSVATWCDVSIPVSVFKAANQALDLRYILTRFSVSDIWSETGNAARTGMTEVRLDNIYWAK
jgi:hypothetical protein